MSKRNKHHKGKGAKQPPQNNPPDTSKPETESPEQVTSDDLKLAESPIKPTNITVTEEKPSLPIEAKPELLVQEENAKITEQATPADVLRQNEFADSPVKPKRHRNKKNKHKDGQQSQDETDKDELSVDVKETSEIKVENVSSVEKLSEVQIKSESGEHVEAEPKKSKRNKKKDKNQNQNIVSENIEKVDKSMEENLSQFMEEKSKTENKNQIQIKGGKNKPEGKPSIKETKRSNEKTVKESEQSKEPEEAKCEINIEKDETKPKKDDGSEKNKKGKQKKSQAEKPAENIEKSKGNEKSTETVSDEHKSSDNKISKGPELVQHDLSQGNKNEKTNKQEFAKNKDKNTADIVEKDKTKELQISDEKLLEKSKKVDNISQTDTPKDKPSITTEKEDTSKGKKKGKQQGNEQPLEQKKSEETKEFASLTTILEASNTVPETKEQEVSEPRQQLLLNVKDNKKRKSKTPDRKPDSPQQNTGKVEDLMEEKKEESVPHLCVESEREKKLERRSKTPEVCDANNVCTNKNDTSDLNTSKIQELTPQPKKSDVKKLTPKQQRKSRSKTPEVKSLKEDQSIVQSQIQQSEKVEHKTETEQKSEGVSYPILGSEQTSVENKSKDVFKTENAKSDKDNVAKAPEIIFDMTVQGSEKETPIIKCSDSTKQEDASKTEKKSMDNIKVCSKKQQKRRSKTPEIKVKSVGDILPSIASSIEETLVRLVSDAENIDAPKGSIVEKNTKTKDDLSLKPSADTIVETIEQKLEGIDKSESEGESVMKHENKNKKSKKSGKKDKNSQPDEIKKEDSDRESNINLQKDLVRNKPEEVDTKEVDQTGAVDVYNKFVIQNPISEGIIQKLLSDVPPSFIDNEEKDKKTEILDDKKQTKTNDENIVTDMKDDDSNKDIEKTGASKSDSIKTEVADSTDKHEDNKQKQDKHSKSKSKKHDKLKDVPEDETSKNIAIEAINEMLIQEIPEIKTLLNVQSVEDSKFSEQHVSEHKSSKKNKNHNNKKQENKPEEVVPVISDSDVLQETKAPEDQVKLEERKEDIKKIVPPDSPQDIKPGGCTEKVCKVECEKKPCSPCPKKKKNEKQKAVPEARTLEQELAEACQIAKPEEINQEQTQSTPIISLQAEMKPLEKSTEEKTQINAEKFELLKLPEDTSASNVQDPQTKDKSKRGSKSPAKQSKNLHGPSSSPAKSSKCDYKKEKNKGNKKSPPDISEVNLKQTTQDIKCDITAQCSKTQEQKIQQKTDTKQEASAAESVSIENIEDLEEEFVYKYSFRTVFIANSCHVCKVQLKDDRVVCRFCHLVSYCAEGHRDDDWASHQSLCYAICTLSHVKAQEHIYSDAKSLNGQDYRLLRMQGIVSCEKILKRKLCPWEQEVLLYPRMCLEPSCREWRNALLKDCENCGQVAYCIVHPHHLPADHASWCSSYRLYHRLVAHQLHQGRIEPALPSKIFQHEFLLPDDVKTLYDDIYGEPQKMDECYHATLTQLSTAPLTALYAYQKTSTVVGAGDQPTTSNMLPKSSLCIHIIGAELQFEADTLNKWECFFLHLVAGLQDLRIVFIGPELNTSNLPVDLLSRIRMCQPCRQSNRAVRFEFHDSMLYHDFVESSKFSKPDLICAFNPGFHRITGYAGLDTWPETIAAAIRLRVPLCITAYTHFEMPRDMARIHSVYPAVKTRLGPLQNPYASLRPDRNFISDDEMPLIFKNYQLAVVSL